MATGTIKQDVEDHITCSVCLEVYKNPHELKCRHTFCLECIQSLQRNNVIKCPKCRNPTDTKDIEIDFKTNSLVDIYKQHETKSEAKTHSIICEMCQNASKEVVFKCVECDRFMCYYCHKTHQGMKVCREHQVLHVSEIAKAFNKDLMKEYRKMEELHKSISEKSENLNRSIKNIEESQKQQLQQIQNYKEDMMKRIKDYCKDLNEKIKSASNQLQQSLTNSQGLCEQMKSQVLSSMKFLEEIMQVEDVGMLTDGIGSISRDTRKQIVDVTAKISDIKTNRSFSVVVNRSEFNPENYITVNINTMPAKTDNPEHIMDYTQLCSKTFQQVKFVGTGKYPQRIHLINDTLWCAVSRIGINIYNKDCIWINTITHDKLKGCMGVTKAHTGDIIVACHDNNGLHQVDSSRRYLGCLADGSFADVCTHEQRIYALEYEQCKLLTFHHISNKWSCVQTLKLQHTNGSWFDKLHVNSLRMSVSSYTNHCLYVYNPEGDFLYKVGEKGSNKAGLFEDPMLSGADYTGNVLMCDYANHRLQIFNQENRQWSVLNVQGELWCPVNAVLDPDGKYMWIIAHGGKGTLYKYSIYDMPQ